MKWMRGLAPLLLLLLLTGCIAQNGEGEGYDVYFLTENVGSEEALEAEKRTLDPEEDPVEGLLTCLLEGPQREDLTRTIPGGLNLRKWRLEDGLLTVDFSSRYGGLSGVDLSLADYSVVRTLTQLEGVETVRITADGEALSYRDHQELSLEDTWDFQQEEAQELLDDEREQETEPPAEE